MSTVIQVDNLSKLYSLGKVGTGSFRQDLKRWWLTSVLRREDPFFREAMKGDAKGNDFLWALRDVSFDVKQGEVFGIIGRNGAGKSTLLKILSGIVMPSQGSVRGRGRINSLLEIGTGFHDELSGRENIFLNGYFLGMHRHEIRKKFDEIVDFSGVEQFLDTPVKRYSSGMYVRLAFAVAAHLEPDILIVDEVLAVGDAEFQKKCLGKMHDVSEKMGRTILYVSHNMPSVVNLCHRAMLLQGGKVAEIGPAEKVVNNYLSSVQRSLKKQYWGTPEQAPGNESIRVKTIELVPGLDAPDDPIDTRTHLTIWFQFWNLIADTSISVGLQLFTQSGECIFSVNSQSAYYEEGLIEGQCDIPGNFLNDGSYYFSLSFFKDASVELFRLEECLSVEIEDYRDDTNGYGKWLGYVRPKFPFSITQQTWEKVL
jgi:lipopolysaccharide transport system ATP-binding protein